MKQTKQTYTVLKPFVQDHQVRKVGDTLELFPKQATYLVTGGFLEAAKTTKSKSSTTKG
ncbi:hypothetical protein [Thiomicrorhabdus cannonii]|uniref:hypothetical protein n=1 Tax=Thiomicrorhabdus cannonii TaxID=2748011 RepID=UPI0015BB0330|nr:hypothetical protein [Thiomicrorhabdus cannonii]